MRKIVIIILFFSLLSWIIAIASGCKTTKHINKSAGKTDSIAAHVIDSTVTSEIEHTTKDLLEHSEIKNDRTEKTIVTTTEEFTPDPKTGEPKLQKRTTHTTTKKNNVQKLSSKKTDNSIVDIRRDSVHKKDSSGAIVHRENKEFNKEVKKKTPLGVYATIGIIAALAIASAFLFFYLRDKKNRA
jgi:flagellar motility protein MotE (MotC chaperone)